MPAVIVFGSVFGGIDPGAGKDAGERIRVAEDAEQVVGAFGESSTGFASFELDNRPGTRVWVNRNEVRLVREAAGRGDDAA